MDRGDMYMKSIYKTTLRIEDILVVLKNFGKGFVISPVVIVYSNVLETDSDFSTQYIIFLITL